MKDIRDILTVEDNEIELSERSVEIDVRTQAVELREAVNAIKQTMTAKELVALSAPAIGIKRRIFCIKFDNEIKTFVNPVIAQAKGLQLSREKSNLIPGKEYIRPRNNDLLIIYQRPMGQIENRQPVGLAAIIFQQQMDELDGLLLSDVGLEIDEMFDKATEKERQEVINLYLDSLDIRNAEIQKDLETDEELKQLNDGIKYMESILKGETQLDAIPNNKE